MNPKITNPQDTNPNSHNHNQDPRSPGPNGHKPTRAPTRVEHNHPVHKVGPNEPPHDRIRRVKRRREGVVHAPGSRVLTLPRPRDGPRVLARAGDLGEDEEDEDCERAMRDRVAAREDHEEGRHVVRDVEHVARVEKDVVKKICEEVGGAVVEDEFLEGGVGGSEAAVAIGEEGGEAEDCGGGAVKERDQAAGEFGSDLGGLFAENKEVSDQVYGEEHNEEWEDGPAF